MSRPISPEQYEPSWNAAAQAEAEARFEAEVTAGPIVDNAGHLTVIGQLEYDGPRCALDCGTAVDNDGEWCDPCGDNPHDFQHDGSRHDFCVCGRIRSIGGYSPVHGEDWGGAA